MIARELWRRLNARIVGDEFLVDLGTTTVTGVSAWGAAELADTVTWVGHPVLQNLALDAADTALLGSDFARTGYLFERPTIVDEVFTDSYGVDWLVADGSAAPLRHPLEEGDVFAVAGHPRPQWPTRVQDPREHLRPGSLVVADAPTSGLIETCFGLRNSWQFLLDITEEWRVANALLDWALESVASAYETMLRGLPAQPDVVLYGDDYGFQGGMYFSDEDFRTFVRPRLRTLFSRIRKVTDAEICFHCCGAVAPILGDLADLGVDMLNLQNSAKGMGLDAVRAALPHDLVLHGYTDLRQLGESLDAGDRRSVAILAGELVRSAPAVAAPVDNLAGIVELRQAARGAAFVHALSADDISALRRIGPVSSVLDHAAEASKPHPATPSPAGRPPAAVPITKDTENDTSEPATQLASAHSERSR